MFAAGRPGCVTSPAPSRLFDQVPLPVSELEARFPLTEHLWLTAEGDCRVTACGTPAMIHSGDPWAGLDAFHRVALDYITGLQEREASTRWSEIVRSTTHEAEVIESVSAQLAAAAGAEVTATGVGGGELFAACRAVGEALGIEVQAPRLVRRGRGSPVGARAGDAGADVRLPDAPGHPARGLVAPRRRAAGRHALGRRRPSSARRLAPDRAPADLVGAFVRCPDSRRTDPPRRSADRRVDRAPGLALLPAAPGSTAWGCATFPLLPRT